MKLGQLVSVAESREMKSDNEKMWQQEPWSLPSFTLLASSLEEES